MAARIGILTASDRATLGTYEDKSGPAIQEVLKDILTSPWEAVPRLVADELSDIIQSLTVLSDDENCSLILTTGGTGPALRDVTPEATEQVCQKMLPGFGELMRQESLKQVPTAILSRQTAGIRGKSLVVNLPGRPNSIRLCLLAVFPAIPYCLDLIGGARLETNSQICRSFRPSP